MRWLIWSVLLATTNGTGTLASRARNTPSYKYHSIAALLSHGTFFASSLVGIDLFIEIINTHSLALIAKGFTVYALSSTLGSVGIHWIAINFFEKGNRRVGAYEDTK